MSNRFDKSLKKIGEFATALRRKNPNSPVFFLLPHFTRLLKFVGDDDMTMVDNFCEILIADPDKPKDGRNVDGTRCHKTYMSKNNRKKMYRVLYYHRKTQNEVYFIFLYARDDQAELTSEQTKRINRITEQIEEGLLVLNPLGKESS